MIADIIIGSLVDLAGNVIYWTVGSVWRGGKRTWQRIRGTL